jgi:two-component system NtrC family sensor kinase
MIRKAIEMKQSKQAPHDSSPEGRRVSRSEIWSPINALSAGIAHEINNPLGIIAQEAQLIKYELSGELFESSVGRAECLDSVDEIIRQVDRCKEIVSKLLSLARQSKPVMQRADLNAIVIEMLNLAERQSFADKDVKMVRNLHRGLPIVRTDPPLLRQVILNIINNAVQAIDKQGTVIVSTAPAGEWVEMAVTDDGCGIPPENLGRIFTPFYSTKVQGKGTGLGLAICRGIVERLGGEITVASEVGRTTTFTVRLPVSGPGKE